MKAYSKSYKQVLQEIGSSENGLTETQVKENIAKFGKNAMTKTKGKTLIKRIADALFEPMLIILEVAWVITLGVNIGKYLKYGNGDFYECIGIFLAIAISVTLTIIMEGKSQKAFEMLSKMYDTVIVKVKRDGVITTVDQTKIVVGDIVYLSSGDKVIADGRLISSATLETDESMLTGESHRVKKFCDVILPEKTSLAERKNCVYSGTFVTSGSGEMVVTAVGDNAEIGMIASELQVKSSISAPLQEKLDRLGKLVTVLGALSAVLVLILSITRLFVNNEVCFDTIQEAFINAIVMIVASVPEGLPTTVAIALTLNVVKLSKSNALIKKLVAAETVGCVSVICSDKTGTLTENKMKVSTFYIGESCLKTDKNIPSDIISNICINSTADVVKKHGDYEYTGSATECALLYETVKMRGIKYNEMREKANIEAITSFDSKIKYMATAIKNSSGNYHIFFKGAPEKILSACNMTASKKAFVLKVCGLEQSQAKRVIAFAHKRALNADLSFEELIFDGLAVITDKVRKDVYDSVSSCKSAGIKIKMLTGDNIETAFAIARELKIAEGRNQVVNASDIDELDDEKLKKVLGNITVVARSTPLTKLRIVKLLKELGEVVAVTGDGINDAPAIKRADIGIAMGGGSEITKEASDIVLLDNSFSTIVKAIAFGRNIYQNFQRFIMFQLSVNATAVLIIISLLLFGYENPFTTLQLLWINLIMDGPPALTLGLESRGNELMNCKPVKRSDNIVTKKMLGRIFIHAALMSAVLIAQCKFNFLGCRQEENSTAIFTLFIIFQLFNAFNCRELGKKSVFSELKSNKLMLYVFTATFAIQIIITEFCGNLFETTPLGLIVWLKIIAVGASVIIISEIYKSIYRSISNRQKMTMKRTKSFN